MIGMGGMRGLARARWATGKLWLSGLLAGALIAPPAVANPLTIIWPEQPFTSATAVAVPDIMGTIALHIPPNSTSTRWAKLMQASLAQPRLELLARDLRGLPPEEQVLRVQSIVAEAVRSAPGASCSDDGYWAPADQTLARGMGDCFDVAITKMEALRSLGVPSKDLYLITGRLRPYEASPVRETVDLLVKVGPRFWLLPEWSSRAIEVDGVSPIGEPRPGAFSPVITYGVGASWVHGRKIQTAAFDPAAAPRLAR